MNESIFTSYSDPLQWRHNGRDSVSNHQPHDCLLNRLFRRRWTKTSKLRVTGLCAGISPGTGEFPAQMASYAENVSIWWRHQLSPGKIKHIHLYHEPRTVFPSPDTACPKTVWWLAIVVKSITFVVISQPRKSCDSYVKLNRVVKKTMVFLQNMCGEYEYVCIRQTNWTGCNLSFNADTFDLKKHREK